MNSKGSDEQLKIVFRQYKAFTIPLIAIVVCVILFLDLILPQFQSWLDLQNRLTTNRNTLDVMTQNLSLITQIDDKKLDDNLRLSVTALPSSGELLGILTAISRAGLTSGVSINDYSFSTDNTTNQDNKAFKLNLVLAGSIENVKNFMTELKSQLPLADIVDAHLSTQSSSSLTAAFYYKDFPKLSFHDDQPMQGINAHEEQLLKKLAGFKHDPIDPSVNIPLSN